MSAARFAPAALALALTACSSSGNTVLERMAPVLRQEVLGGRIFGGETPPAAPHEITRAELNQIPYATISLSSQGSPPAYVVAVAQNGGHVVYEDSARRSIVIDGGLVTATHGLGFDMKGVAHQADDPIAVPMPLPEWPARVNRSYRFSLRSRPDYQIAVACAYQRGVRENIEIAEITFEVVRMVETCADPRRTFVNTYWADPDTGFIWKSEQWLGPRQPPMRIEVIRPYAAS